MKLLGRHSSLDFASDSVRVPKEYIGVRKSWSLRGGENQPMGLATRLAIGIIIGKAIGMAIGMATRASIGIAIGKPYGCGCFRDHVLIHGSVQ